jgi:DNA-binding transcriptional regulator GbsR (MarR family)
MATSDADTRHQFVEQFGLHMEGEGLPRIAGRLWAFLLLQPAPCDAETLGEQLQISHGSVSTNTRLLEAIGIVERVTFPGDRRVHFQVSSDPYTAGLAKRIERQRWLAEMLSRTAEQLPGDEVARERLHALREVNDLVARATAEVVEAWAARRRDDVAVGGAAAGR